MRAVFITDEFGPKELWDKEGLIGRFTNTNINIVKGDDGIKRRVGKQLWTMVLTDDAIIERVKKLPSFNKSVMLSDKEPVYNTLNNIKSLGDPGASMIANIEQLQNKLRDDNQAELKEEKLKLVTKTKRYGELFALVCKAGGVFLKDADPVLVQEFKDLQADLGIKEEPVKNE
jgi:hypothetical protein